ncbi:MAG: hypothetical protein H6582_01615 [Crocinitomicaceae bacterium]|nr:hypothetical protein [Crocinitomicaceae bacterium]
MTAKNFNTSDPDQLIYENDMLTITILGGIKLEGLDRLRATIKIELNGSSRPAVRHNLDLYNDNQLEKFIRKVAEKHEIGTSIIAASLSELTEALEAYRLERLKEQENDHFQPKQLTATEIKEAETFLKSSNLLEKTNELIGQSGVIGEEINRLLMYVIFTSRKREQPLHIISLGASGTGKTHLQEKVGELIPEEDTLSVTTLSENAFYYFGQRELKNKLIMIEDLDGAESALYPLRELQTKKRISKTVVHKNTKGETRSVHLVVEGPVSVAGCTTKESIYEDNSNRSFLIYLDESPKQDEKVMAYQRAISAGKINTADQEAAAELLRNCQRLLQAVKVVNPYAELLKLPVEIFKPRRTNSHYLHFIEAVTFYHQFQRPQQADEETGELFIETTLEDIEQANSLLKEVLLRKSDELTGACRNYLESVKSYLEQEGQTSFSNREIRKALRVNESNQKRYTLNLLSNYYIKRVKGSKSKGYLYEITSYEEYKKLKEQVGNVLDETLENLKKVRQSASGRSKAVQKKNEPRKRSKAADLQQ